MLHSPVREVLQQAHERARSSARSERTREHLLHALLVQPDCIVSPCPPRQARSYSTSSRLFSDRMRQFARTVTINESGGSVKVTESAKGEDGPENLNETTGSAGARSVLLEGCLHLLK